MKILFVSFYFPPYDAIGCLRTGKIAKYLSEVGHDVRVITARNQDIPQKGLPVEIPLDHIFSTYWINPATIVPFARKKSHQTPIADDGQLGSRSKISKWMRSIIKLLTALIYFPDKQVGWIPFASIRGMSLTSKWKPDIILASSGPISSLMVAYLLGRKYRIPWIGDLRDLWTDNQVYSYPSWRRKFEERIERNVLSSASGLITVSEPLGATLKRKVHTPVEIVLNGFEPDDFQSIPEPSLTEDSLHIVYTGMIYSGKQSPVPLFMALKLLGKKAEGFKVSFLGPSGDEVRTAARELEVDHLVNVYDSIPHIKALEKQKGADILLHLLWNDPEQVGVYNAKIFEYIGSRRPILAIGYTGNVTAQLIRERDLGFVSDNSEQIAEQLSKWSVIKSQSGRLPDLAAAVSEGLTRKEQVMRLEKFLVAVKENWQISI